MTTAAIEVNDLTRRYRRKVAVDGISLRVEAGQIIGVLGSNGAGKTTLVETIAGLRAPTSGSVSVLGLDPRRERDRVRQVLGVQLQEAYLHTSLTGRELIALYRSFYPNPRSAEELLSLVDLTDHADTHFEKLSGGQRQRLNVALALVGRPRVVILDELTTGMDPRARRRVWAAVEDLREQGVTVVLVSHAMDEVERLCDSVVLLDSGRIIAEGTPAQVTAKAGTDTLEEAFVALTGNDVFEEEL